MEGRYVEGGGGRRVVDIEREVEGQKDRCVCVCVEGRRGVGREGGRGVWMTGVYVWKRKGG